MTQLADDLRAAKALIDTPEKWARGSNNGDCLCALDALAFETDYNVVLVGERWRDGERALRDALPYRIEEKKFGHPVVYFNDAPDTTHAVIMALFDRAIAAAESEDA